jgi:uncharacterized protein
MPRLKVSADNVDFVLDVIASRPPFDLPSGQYVALATRPGTRAAKHEQQAPTLLDALRKLDALSWIRKKQRELAGWGLPADIDSAGLGALVRYVAHWHFDLAVMDPGDDAMLASLARPTKRFVLGFSRGDEAYAVLLAQPRDDAGPAARGLIAAIAAGEPAPRSPLDARARAEIDGTDGEAATALHHAVAARSLQWVQALLDAGANPNAGASFGNTPLFAARRADGTVGPVAQAIEDARHFGLLCKLVDAGGDPDAVVSGRDVCTLLETASDDAAPEWIEAWLARGARPRALHFPQPLHRALSKFFRGPETPESIIAAARKFRMLLRAGADANERSEKTTILHELLGETTGLLPEDPRRAELLPMVEALIERGATEEADRDGAYPADYAIGWGYDEVLPKLSRFSAAGLRRAASRGRLSWVERLLAQGIDVDECDASFLRSALHFAADAGHVEVVRRLLAAGADRERTDRQGRTPMDLAGSSGHDAVVALLRR